MRISYSAIETFKKCPQKYKFKEIDRLKEPPSLDAMFGAAIHDALQYFHSQKQLLSAQAGPALENLLSYFSEKWSEKKEKLADRNLPDFQLQLIKQDAKNLLTNYYNDNKDKQLHIVALESKFEVPIKHGDDFHILTGKIDRIDRLKDGSFEIIDYKTGRQLPSQDTVNENLQLAIYHLGLIAKWPEFESRNIKSTLYFLKHREKISAEKKTEDLTNTKDKLVKTIEEIQNSKFNPIASPLCDFCGFKDTCPMWKHKTAVNNEQITVNENQIQQAITEFFELKDTISKNEKRLDELKSQINAFCDQNNLEQVFGDNGSIMRQLQQRYEYEPQKIQEILEPLGKWQEIMAVDSAKLKELQKSLPLHIRNSIQGSKILASEFKKFLAKKKKGSAGEVDNSDSI